MRLRSRIDTNHGEIADAFRKFGWSVLSLASVGNGCPDLLVSRRNELKLVEVKRPKGKLTKDQVMFHQAFPVAIVRSVEDVIALSAGGGRPSAAGA